LCISETENYAEYIAETQADGLIEYEEVEEDDGAQLLLEQAAAEERRREWEEAEYRARTEAVFFPLLEYREKYPDSEFAEDLEDLLKEMADAFERKRDLPEYMRDEDISVIITGSSINEINLDLKNNTESWLIMDLPLGLYFIADKENVQNMVLTESMNILSVGTGESLSITAQVACMDIYKDIPDGNDMFGIDMLEENDPLLDLLNIFGIYRSGFEVMQAAVWILQDNPTRQAVMAALEYDDGEQAVSDGDYDEALRLVEMVKG